MSFCVKICGLANEQDILETIRLKPDALGFIFWPKSPRAVRAEKIAEWTRDQVPEGMRKVGVFVNASADEIKRTVETAGLDVIQLHGEESADLAKSLDMPIWKVLHLDRLHDGWDCFPAERYLIDSGTVEMPGGTGVHVDTFRAKEFVRKSKLPVMLAGGLKAGTVGDVIKVVRPAGVDVSSGVEQSPGKKNMQAVSDFIRNAREASLTL